MTAVPLPSSLLTPPSSLLQVTAGRSYLFECEVAEELVQNVKFKVVGKLVDPETKAPLAVCNATIANVGMIPEARKSRYGE